MSLTVKKEFLEFGVSGGTRAETHKILNKTLRDYLGVDEYTDLSQLVFDVTINTSLETVSYASGVAVQSYFTTRLSCYIY